MATKLWTDDEDLLEARGQLLSALQVMGHYGTERERLILAIEAMIELKIAIAVEALADRIEDATGAHP